MVTAQAPLPGQAPPTIPVVQPKVQTVSDYLEITGNAAAVNQVKLIARVVGFLDQLHFADGALVKKGDLLFTIQQDQYKAQLQQAQAQLQPQQAALLYAKTEVVRYTALLKQGRGDPGRCRSLELRAARVRRRISRRLRPRWHWLN